MKKATNDFTIGSVDKKLIDFAIPIILGNILMQLYNYADSVIVGRFVGKEALAAVGASTPFIFMLVSLIIGISMGSTIIIAQYYGKNDFESIRKASDSLYIFLIVAAVIISIFGFTFSGKVMELIDLPAEIIPQATAYLDIYMVGLIFLFLFSSLSAILRGVGDSKTPLIFLIVSSILNICLDLLFVVVFGFGIEGAAWATVVSQGVAVVFAFAYTARHNKVISTNLLKLKFDVEIFMRSIKIGIPAGMQQLFVSIGMLAIMSFVNGFGTDTIAGYAAASRIESFVLVIPINLSIALTNFTAQNYGAGLKDRVRLGVRAALKFSLVASFVILIVLSALALPLMQMFSSESDVINVGTTYLYILGVSYSLFVVMFCYMGALRGMGNTIVPMFITLFSLWLIRVPMAGFLSNFWGEIGIWVSGSFSWALGAISAYIFYHREYRKELPKSVHSLKSMESADSVVL